MKMPRSTTGQFCFYFGMQFASYFLIVANMRAIATISMFWTGATDFAIATQGYWIMRSISQQADGFWPWLGYALGGMCGSLFSLLVTKHLIGVAHVG